MSPLLALACVLCAFPLAARSLGAPARPAISAVYEASLDAFINATADGRTTSLKGTAIFAADTKKFVETTTFVFPIKETTLALWREDLGKTCTGYTVATQSACTCEDVSAPVPNIWSPLASATFEKTAPCTGVSPSRDCDFWGFAIENGTVTYEVFSDAVNTPSSFHAAGRSEQGDSSVLYVVTKWKTSAVDQTLFAIPTTCTNALSAARPSKTASIAESVRRLIGLKN